MDRDDELPPQEWLAIAVGLLGEEAQCSKEHVEKGEWGPVLLHISNMMSGLNVCAQLIMKENLCDLFELAQVNAQLLSDKRGEPWVAEKDEDGNIRMVLRPMEVPDDLSGLEGEYE